MKTVPLDGVEYIGADTDLVAALVASNSAQFSRPGRRFILADVTKTDLPRVDVILCRDCFIHLPFFAIRAALMNFRRSGARYVLTTHYPGVESQVDIEFGSFRPLNLELPPFAFPKPLKCIADAPLGSTQPEGRCLALWRLLDLPLD